MDIIIVIGAVIFGIGVLTLAFNTKIRYGLVTRYTRRNKGVGWLGILLMLIGLVIILLKIYLNGQFGWN